MFESIGEGIKKYVNTPANRDLFNKDEDRLSKLLDDKKAESFHHVVSKLLYVSKRARLDINLGISYLCTRVSCSTENDW